MGEGAVPASYLDYLVMLRDVFTECWRVLEPGGRIAVNIANLGRKPFRSLASDVTTILQNDLGFLLRGEIVWIKAEGASGNCAWGSYASAANPVLRDLTERIVIASKGRFDRAQKRAVREKNGLPFENSIDPDDFMAWTLDTWKIAPESAKRVGHPAPFPAELPVDASNCSPMSATPCSTHLWVLAKPPLPQCAPVAITWAWNSIPTMSPLPSGEWKKHEPLVDWFHAHQGNQPRCLHHR